MYWLLWIYYFYLNRLKHFTVKCYYLIHFYSYMSIDQLRSFLKKMQSDDSLKKEVLTSSTADDVALIALRRGYEFSGDELLRFSGKKVGRVTVQKNDVPGEYN